MADVIYKKGQSANLDDVEIADGQILVTEDTGEMYIDMSDGTRKKITDNNKPGLKTAEGGEIFNAEYDNTAGGRCFSIKSINKNLIRKNLEALAEQGLTLNADGSFELVFGDDIPIFTLNPGKYYVSTLGEYTTNREPDDYVNITYGPSGTVWYQISGIVENGSFFRLDQSGVLEITEKTTLCLTCHQTGPLGPGGREIETGRLFISITKGQTPPTTLECQEYDYELDSVEGIEVGDIYSLKIGANYDFYGKVTHLDTNNNIVTVSSFTEGTTTDLSDAVMWFPYKPQIGTQVNGGAQHSEGYATTAINWGSHSEGFNTLAEGKYSHTENHSTVAGYASHAEGQNTKALGEWSHAQGMATSALNRYTFSFGNSTVSMENYFDKKVLTTLTNEEIEEVWKKASPRFTCANGYASTAGGNNTLALGAVSTALGKETIAKGNHSLSTGYLTSAEGNNSLTSGFNNKTYGDNSTTLGSANISYGTNNFITGSSNSIVIGQYDEWPQYLLSNKNFANITLMGNSNSIYDGSPGYPWGNDIYAENCYIEGSKNALALFANSTIKNVHVEGYGNGSIGANISSTHIEGYSNDISTFSDVGTAHIEGKDNHIYTRVNTVHVEGCENTVGSYNGDDSLVEYAHVEGRANTVYCNIVHVEGLGNTAMKKSTAGHVGGWQNTINGDAAFAHGHGLIAKGTCSIAVGKWNVESDASSKSLDTAQFTVGIGTDTNNRKNAFCVLRNGNVTAAGTYQTSGADYSELFEWIDGNINNEDRRGYFVTLDGDKIRIANSEDDYILGIVSATPSVLGDSYFGSNWHGKYLTDIFGTIITETIHVEEKPICIKEEYIDKRVLEDGTVKEYIEPAQYEIIPAHDETIPVINPDYDPEREYIDRLNRQEWTPIGMMGKLVVIDDGTCKVNGYCKVSSNGIATNSENGYRVMSRLDDTHIRILFK